MRWLTLLLALQQPLWIDVPFIRQDKNGCGSASIWMVMQYWRPDTPLDVDEIQQQLYSKEGGGIYARDMARYFELHGYRVFAFRGEWSDLQEHLAKGRPLIVSLERGPRGVPLHYVVVAGIDPTLNIVLVNDPAQRKLLSMSRAEFERSWQATDQWTLMAMPELDLASRAFRSEHLPEARDHLTSALRVNPSDGYANDFLATIYFLEDNTDAALKYWNRTGKPVIENIRIDPPLDTDPILLDRAFAFSRGSVLRLSDFEKTQARLAALGVFSRYRMELSPTDGERFNLTFRAAERSGMNVWSWARGLPFQSIHPEFSNIGGKAVNVGSTFRWDPNKRRGLAMVETPLSGDPKWGIRLTIDARDENWTSVSGGFRMKTIQTAAEIRAVPSGRWSWTSGAGLSTRHFSTSFSSGMQLKHFASMTRTLLREPSRHLNLDATVASEAGKLWAAVPARFAKVVSGTSLRWGPLTSQLRAGRGFGAVPFDERFVVGLERDSDLWLRAHPATVDGRKNASNTSRSFVISNSDFQRTALNTAWFRIGAGPFLDVGKSAISPRWLVDTGLELRFSVLGSFGIRFSYGRSVNDGRQALFVREL